MGGFSAQVQQPTNRPSGGKGIAGMVDQVNQRPDGLDQNAINADPQGFQRWQQNGYGNNPNVVAQGGGNGLAGTGIASTPFKAVGMAPPSVAQEDPNFYRQYQQSDQQPMMSDMQYRPAPQPMAKGGNYQSNVTSGQPRMGQANPYPNTVGQWDNAQIQPVRQQNGKGKGG